jgi:hypothetical protein
MYSKEKFIKYFIGCDLEFATEEEIDRLIQSPVYESVPTYPYYGSICYIDGYIVVKFSDMN